ncbi:restriction endonuclease subunit S [Vibrio fluvialis]|nr:restriction endonuclease subunit S [Vibrio fluvialis]
MTGRYKAYPDYKKSGVEWLGDVPENWSVHSLKRTVDNVTNGIWGSEPDGENDLIVIRVADFNRNQLNISDDKLTFRSIENKDRKTRLLKKGDLLIEKSGGGDKTLVGCVVLFDKDYEAVTSNFVAKMTPQQGFDSSFLRYAFSYLYAGKVNYSSIKQTTGIQNLDSEAYLLEKLAFPLYEEQQKIANFLDHETAKIDTLITKQEKLIELLKEKRQAVISHAVTKGLNPDAPMKDSGVEWLGEVPEHWVVTSIKRELKSLDSRRIPLSADERGKRTGEYRYYGASGVIDFIDDYIFDEPTVLVGEDGANLLNRNTPLAFSAHGQYWVNNHAHILSPLDGLVDYWAEVIEIIDVTPIVSGSAQPKLTAEALNNLKISFPASLEERQTIEKFICIQQSKYDQLMRKAKNQVELLKERKTALISAAVTGKIDVRDWQEPTYQESA